MTRTTQELFEIAMKKITYGESGMTPIKNQKSIGFFPAGSGFWEGKETLLNDKTVLILGQDFNNEVEFEKYEKDKEKSEDPDKNKTWRNLKTLLSELQIKLDDCFFSNVYMGLRKGNLSNKGACPGVQNEAYRVSCEEFLKNQINAVEPSLIILLGFEPLKAIRKVFPKELAEWNNVKTTSEIVLSNDKQVIVANINNKNVKVAFVIHPSMNATNRSRIFGKGKGSIEIEKLKNLL